MLHSHFLLLMLRAHLLVMRRMLIHRMLPASTAGSGHFAGVRFALVSARVSLVPLISGLQVVSVCSGISCSLKIMFRYVPGFISTFSCTRYSCCSPCGPKSLRALALPGAFALVE